MFRTTNKDMTKRYTNKMWIYEYMISKEQRDLKFSISNNRY